MQLLSAHKITNIGLVKVSLGAVICPLFLVNLIFSKYLEMSLKLKKKWLHDRLVND